MVTLFTNLVYEMLRMILALMWGLAWGLGFALSGFPELDPAPWECDYPGACEE